MSDTPRTDKNEVWSQGQWSSETCWEGFESWAEFARSLERDRSRLRESVRRLVGEWREEIDRSVAGTSYLNIEERAYLNAVERCADELEAFLAENKEL